MDQETIKQLDSEFENAAPEDVLYWATRAYGSKLALVTSFQPTGIVTMHMLSQIAPETPVITLDTGLLFPETIALADELEARLNLNLIRVRPEQTVREQAIEHGPGLWETDPNQCCNLRKVVPLGNALRGYDAWLAGLRRDQSMGRSQTPVVGWDKRHQLVKICPLAAWDESMVWTYIDAYELPYNPLHDLGYPSIGCWPCTAAVQPDTDDLRAGRWAHSAKTECGIHLPEAALAST